MTLKLNAELFTEVANDPEQNRRAVAAAYETLATQGAAVVPDTVWRHYLRWSARPEVLGSLDVATRYQWAADAVALLAQSPSRFSDMVLSVGKRRMGAKSKAACDCETVGDDWRFELSKYYVDIW